MKLFSLVEFLYSQNISLSDASSGHKNDPVACSRNDNASVNLKNSGVKESGPGQLESEPLEKTAAVSSASQNQAVSLRQ